MSSPQIQYGKLFGITHKADGTRSDRMVKLLKVAIGVPIGPDVHVWITKSGKWKIEIGTRVEGKRVPKHAEYGSKAEAFAAYVEARKTAPERKAPRKLPYFTFVRLNADGLYVHDFDAIELYGAVPTGIGILLMRENALFSRFAYFTRTELKCEGDGINARRRNTMAATPEEKALAEAAEKAGEKFFPIVDGCYIAGCRYAQEDEKGVKLCKPNSQLRFQLLDNPAFGGTCWFESTGIRTSDNLGSFIEELRENAGTISGIPLMMFVRPYRTSHHGKPTMQFGIHLEYRPGLTGGAALLKGMVGAASDFAAVASRKQLAAPPEEPLTAEEVEEVLQPDNPDEAAPRMANEFYDDGDWDPETIMDGEFEDIEEEPSDEFKEPTEKS